MLFVYQKEKTSSFSLTKNWGENIGETRYDFADVIKFLRAELAPAQRAINFDEISSKVAVVYTMRTLYETMLYKAKYFEKQ